MVRDETQAPQRSGYGEYVSVMATVLIGCAGIAAYLAIYFLVLFLVRRSRDHLFFGLSCVGLFGVAVGNGALTLGTPALSSVTFVGATFGIAAFSHFVAVRIADDKHLRIVTMVLVACAVVMHLSPRADPRAHIIFFHAPAYVGGFLSWPGVIAVAITSALALRASALLYLRSSHPLGAGIGVAFVCLAIATANDVALRAGVVRSYYLVEITVLGLLSLVGYSLIDEFNSMQDELAARNAELAERVLAIADARQRLLRKEQLAAIGELSGVIAHAVRNPLAIIKNSVSGSRRAPEPPEILLDIMDEEISRLARLAEELLEYVRPLSRRPRSVSLNDIVSRAMERVSEEAPREVVVEGTDHLVSVDPDLVAQAVARLLENAFVAAGANGTVTVRSSKADDIVELSVSDSGAGFSEEGLARAKHPFFTTRATGTGLGLAFVERVAEVHGGSLTVANREEGGATATLRWSAGA